MAKVTITARPTDMTFTWKLLEEVQGPEQGLVGESRSGSETWPAKEAKPGERGVGEIVELAELLRHIERKIDEARAVKADLDRFAGASGASRIQHGKLIALSELLGYVERMTEKRSDLSHEKSPDAGANEMKS